MATDNGAFPELTIDVGQSAQYNTSRPVSTLEQTVEGTLREVLAWRPRTTDSKGFLAALKQAFTEQEVDGQTTWAWTPRSYSVQADMGAVTGAQASIYTRARAALDQSVPLIEGLRPLRADADDEDVVAIRALVQSQLTELIDELGVVGGPRQDRIKGLFDTLLGDKTPINDLDEVKGLLGLMRDRFGLERQRVNTVEEEQILTNFLIIVDHVLGLQRSWVTFTKGKDVFLGTHLVLLSRSLDVIAESVRELYFKMDSVWLGEAERQTLTLQSGLTIAELLSWVERFANEEGPRIINEGGKDGVINSFQPTLRKLNDLVQLALKESQGTGKLPKAFSSDRVKTGLEELTIHLSKAVGLANDIRREPVPQITAVNPPFSPPLNKVRLTVGGRYFQDGAKVQLHKTPSDPNPIKGKKAKVVGTTQINVKFDLATAVAGKYSVVVINPDDAQTVLPESFTVSLAQPTTPVSPTANFTYPIRALVQSPAQFKNQTQGTPPITYTWDFGDGSPLSALENPTHDYASEGSYTVTLTATNNFGSDSHSDVVRVGIAPTAVSSHPATASANAPVQFTDQSTGTPGLSHTWDFGDGSPVSTAVNPSYSYTISGTYTIRLTVNNLFGTDVATSTITIDDKPVAPTAAFTVTTPAILNQPVTFINQTKGPRPLSYSWDFGDGNVSTDENPSHTFANAGPYTVKLTATNATGTNDVSQIVQVGPDGPEETFTVSDVSLIMDDKSLVSVNDGQPIVPNGIVKGIAITFNNSVDEFSVKQYTTDRPANFCVAYKQDDGTILHGEIELSDYETILHGEIEISDKEIKWYVTSVYTPVRSIARSITHGGLESMPAGYYGVLLYGGDEADDESEQAIKDTSGARLDGDKNEQEGGIYLCTFTIVDTSTKETA